MTHEEAIKILKGAIKKPNTEDGYMGQALTMAIKALERTEPKEVIYSGDGYYDGELVYDLAECPECGYEYEEGDIGWGLPFCPKCGQALEWEVEDDQR